MKTIHRNALIALPLPFIIAACGGGDGGADAGTGTPITLPASTTHTASGTATASAQATLRALQTVNSVSYEITSTNANLDTGAYSLAQPAAALLVGTYSTTLPIALSAVSASAGQYSVQAISASGTTLGSTANVSAGNQTGVNFSF